MAGFTVLIGAILTGIGLVGYLSPDTLGANDPGKTSPTALIPAAIGGVLLLCGLVVMAAPHVRKHAMHLAALAGLIGALGGFMPIMRGGMALEKASVRSGLAMVILCAIFVAACIRSFVLARMAKSQGLK